MTSPHNRHGFTLIELLVVIAIVAILMALLLPAVQKVREAANKMRCANNLKQFGIAIHSYANDNGHLPRNRVRNMPRSVPPDTVLNITWREENGSWLVATLPYMEQGRLYDRFAPFIKDDDEDYPPQGYPTNAYPPGDCRVPGSNNSFCRIQRGLTGNGSDVWGTGPAPNWPGSAAQHVVHQKAATPDYMRCPSLDHDYHHWPMSTYAGSMGPQCVWGLCGYDPYLSYCDHVRFTPRTADEFRNQQVRDPNRTRGLFNSGGPLYRLKDIKDGTTNTIAVGECIPYQMDLSPIDVMHFQDPAVEATNSGPNHWAYENAGGHWLASNGKNVVHTLAPINYRTDNHLACNPPHTLALMGHASPTPVSADREIIEHSFTSWNLSMGFKSRHPGGANFVFADGSVRFLPEDIDHWTYQFLGCRNDGVHIEDY